MRWQPLTTDGIAAIVRRAFGNHVSPIRADKVAGGTVNEVWRLTLAGRPPLILRVGPTSGAAKEGPSWLPRDTLQREYALTPWFAPVAPLLPATIVADFTHQVLDRDWVIQTLVPGQPWAELSASLTDAQHASLWRQLGEITRRVHMVGGTAFGPLPPGPSFPRWSDLLQHDAGGVAADFARFGLPMAPAERLRQAIASNTAILDTAGPSRLIHSDLDPRHVFITTSANDDPVISGLIDYEFGRFADPLSEGLLLSLALEPSAGSAPFFAGYGPIPSDAATRWRMRLYQAVSLGWTAGDQARQGQDTSGTVAALDGIVWDLAQPRHSP